MALVGRVRAVVLLAVALAVVARVAPVVAAEGAAPSATAPSPAPDPSQWYTNGAQATSVPTTGPGAAYYTNGAEATAYPTAAPTVEQAPPPQQVAPAPAPSVEAAPAPAPPPSVAPAPAPPPVARAPRPALPPGAEWIQAKPIVEPPPSPPTVAVDTAAPPVAIEAPAGAGVTLTSGEAPRATVSLVSADSGSLFGGGSSSGGSLAMIFMALVTGIVVGVTAVVRFRSGGATGSGSGGRPT